MTATGLAVAPDLTLPLEAVTETFAILAKRRVGKSNAAVVMAEQMYDAGLPWCAIDPNIPLEPGAGAYIADLIAEQRLTCVLDVSGFSKADQIRFLQAFAERLLRVNRDPLLASPDWKLLDGAAVRGLWQP